MPEDVQNYWERKNSALMEAFQEGSRTYNLLRDPSASITSLKLNEQSLIPLDAAAHDPEDYVQKVTDLLQREEHQAKSEQIRAHLQGFGLEAPKDKNYPLIVKVLNLSVSGNLAHDKKLLGMLNEKFSAVFGKDAPNELVALGYEIGNTKEIHPTPTLTPTPSLAHSPASESTTGTVLRPITPPGIQN